MLYKRNFITLTEIEKNQIRIAKEEFENGKTEDGISTEVLSKYHDMLPDAYYHNASLFPNNFLNTRYLKDTDALDKIYAAFKSLLEEGISERDILNFINKGDNFNLIGSLFHSGYLFGHHKAFLFKEFELTSTYRADYLLVGKNSHGYNFVFVELENPSGQITLKSGDLGETFRKGISQVEDWDTWLDGNFHCLSLMFDKYKKPSISLPREFYKLDKSRIHYAVVAGRRTDFNEKTYEIKRKLLKRTGIQLLHYDNVLDCFEELKVRANY